ncbi:MAG: WG repeat-containing protein [Bacteroidota bacterium]
MAKFVKCDNCGYYPVEFGYICTKCGAMQSKNNVPTKEIKVASEKTEITTDKAPTKKLNIKLVVIIIIVLVVVAGLFFTRKYFLFDSPSYTEKSSQDSILRKVTIDTTNLVLAMVEDNNKIFFIDTTGNIVIKKGYDAAEPFHEGLAAVKVNGKWGYIDVKENIIIEPSFELAGNFSEGYACVGKANVKIEGKYVTYDQFGFINKTGKTVIPFKYFYSSSSVFSEGLVDVGYMDKHGDIYYAFINTKGDNVIVLVDNKEINHAGKFINGVAKIETTSRDLFLINKKGTIVDKTSDQDFSKSDKKVDFGIYPDKEPDKSLGTVDEQGRPLKIIGLKGYKNRKNIWVIKPKYAFASDFSYTYNSKSIVIDNNIKKTSEENHKNILLKSYKALENSSFEATDYFSKNVDLYVTMKNTTPNKINSYINNSFYKEFQKPTYVIEEDGYSEKKNDNGELIITFIEKLNCYRKSKQRNQILRTKTEVIFNINNKIRYWKQLQILQNDYL